MWDWRRSCWAAEAEKRKSEKAENAGLTNMHLCAIINLAFAGVAHLVERDLAKVEVASSSLVARSKKKHHPSGWCFFRVLRGAHRRVSRLPPAGAVRQPGHFLETASLHPPQAALRRFPRRPRAGDRKRKRNPTKVSLAHSPLPCGIQGCGQQIQLPCGESRMAAVISGSPVSGREGAQCQTVCARDAITGSVSRLSSVDSVTRWAA